MFRRTVDASERARQGIDLASLYRCPVACDNHKASPLTWRTGYEGRVAHSYPPVVGQQCSQAGAEVLQLARLTVEPFAEGSFVIPAKREADPIETQATGQRRQVTAQDVVHRFDAILTAFQAPQPVTEVSIGALQAIEALGRIIRREAGAVEDALFDTIGRPAKPILVTPQTIDRVTQVRQARRPSQARSEALEGTLTALDLVRATLELSPDGTKGRVRGTYPMLFQPSLVACLGKRVRLHGRVARRGRRVVSVQVLAVEALEEES
jgi:hypothetical protein